MRLYDITNDYNEVLEMLENNVEVSDEALADTLEGIEGEFEDKVNNMCKLVKNNAADVDALDEEIKRLQAKKKAKENAIVSLKSLIAYGMYAMGRDKVKTPLFSLYGLKNDKLVVDSKLVPEEYKKVVESKRVDEKAIKEAMAKGEAVSGAKYIYSVTVR